MLRGNIQSLLGAGSTPSRATIEWLFITMAAYPNIQKKVQEELDSMVGRDRMPCWSDHPDLPYTQAVIAETQRWKTVIPISMLRSPSHDTSIQGFTIPKGAVVMTNLWAVHHDPDYWEEPETFLPERFLDKGGQKILKPDWFMPFSHGKRSCPGEKLAIAEIFLYFTWTLHRFALELPPGTPACFERDLGIAQLVKPYKLCLRPRK